MVTGQWEKGWRQEKSTNLGNRMVGVMRGSVKDDLDVLHLQ